jgi:hypothetical protein
MNIFNKLGVNTVAETWIPKDLKWRHDIQHNDIQHNDFQHYDIQHIGIQHYDIPQYDI